MGVTALVIAVELQEVRIKCIFSDFERGLGRVSKCHICEKGKKVFKKSVFTEFTSRYLI